ncbi:hypothetical protein EZV62_022180 [Acer yangbiense]|uniref:Uncharacterized protein n=1 Tax=Acer yangbiense TaxID=1000413 RepID=A0A5C7H7U6_9ROSI|nr:hypothetical protein EZV62_022180 [Acer yangbiense]
MLVPNVKTRCKIDGELYKYKRAEVLFGSPMTVRMRGLKSPVEDNLTWNDVATAAKVRQSSYRFRSREASSSWVSQQSQIQSSLQLVDEEESEEEIGGEDEGSTLRRRSSKGDWRRG